MIYQVEAKKIVFHRRLGKIFDKNLSKVEKNESNQQWRHF